MNKSGINKDVVPEGFTISLAIVDGLPVILFSIAFILLGSFLENTMFMLSAILVLVAGAIKVLWKLIVVLKKKNIWWMFVQMRIVMPLGFILMLLSLIIFKSAIPVATFWLLIKQSGAWFFLILAVVGMIAMIVCATKLDSSYLKSNWLEQLINSFAQLMFLIAVLLII